MARVMLVEGHINDLNLNPTGKHLYQVQKLTQIYMFF